jgi:hypothetical protein
MPWVAMAPTLFAPRSYKASADWQTRLPACPKASNVNENVTKRRLFQGGGGSAICVARCGAQRFIGDAREGGSRSAFVQFGSQGCTYVGKRRAGPVSMMSSMMMHSLFATSPTRFKLMLEEVVCLIVMASETFSTPDEVKHTNELWQSQTKCRLK